MMKIVCLLAVLAMANAGDVLQFTDSDFESQMGQHDMVLMKFYAPWCGHCKKLAPEYEKAATILKDDDPSVTLAEIDCTSETKTCDEFEVSGYPTLKIFYQGEFKEDYEGDREADGIVKYMRSKAGPTAKVITTEAEMVKLLARGEHSIVAFADCEDCDLIKTFKKLADSLSEDFKFAYTTESSLLEKHGYNNDVVIFQPSHLSNKFEDSELKYDGDLVLHKLKSWVNDNIHGLAGHRTSGNSNQFKRPLITAFYEVDYTRNAKGTNYWRNRVMKVAKKLKDEGKTAYFSIASRDEFGHELSEFGIDARDDKPVVTARDQSEQKFVMKSEFSMDNLEAFVNDLLDGKLKPYLKSEPIPEQNQPVKVAVAENFNDLVNDPEKDVLIEFYAPWCGHCKTLAPKYDELAEKLADEDGIVIAKMDATANDVPKPYEVRGFPTLFFAPAGSKDRPRKYEGGREVNDFIKYLAKESTNPLKGYDRDGKKIKKKKEEL